MFVKPFCFCYYELKVKIIGAMLLWPRTVIMRTKHVLFIIAGIVLAMGAIFTGFTIYQANREQLTLSLDLQYRTRLLADSLKESVEPNYGRNSTAELQKLVDKFANREHVVGLAIYDNRAGKVAASQNLPAKFLSGLPLIGEVMDNDKTKGEFIRDGEKSFYVLVEPIRQVDRVIGAFLVAQNANYIDSGIRQIWENNLLRLLIQIIIFTAVVALLIRWIVVRPVMKLVESVKAARLSGNPDQALQKIKEQAFFKPLVGEIFKMTKSLSDARLSASEEARMRLEKLDTPWTAERLKEFTKAYLKNRPIFVVSNLEPYMHQKVKNEIHYSVPPSGLVTALNPVMEACGGMWIARSYGDADRETVDIDDKIAVPPDDPKYTLKRVWLTDKEIKGFHKGFSNEGLWPLCLMVHTRPVFRKNDWKEYAHVNGIFATSLLKEIKNVREPLILIQDYHLSLLPNIIKKSRPDARVALFWHLPWPSAEQFSICPWRKEILEGMLGADLVGFHTQQYCNNFIDTVGKEVESLIDFERFSITHNKHTASIKTFPLSINFTKEDADDTAVDKTLLKELGITTPLLGIGVDKMDYVKGIVERFQGVEQFLLAHPDYKNRFTFLQIAPLCRTDMEIYKKYEESVTEEAERINKSLGTNNWKPIVLVKKEYSHQKLTSLYRLADFLAITSLHEGMNLVAKEFAAARNDEAGVLILSPFTGASRELRGALMVNPYNTAHIGEAIATALTMPKTEQRERMHIMRNSVKNYNIYRWAAELIKALADLG